MSSNRPASDEPFGATPLHLISLVTDKLVGTLDFDQALHTLIEGATDLLQVERGSIMILDHDSGTLTIKVGKGLDEAVIRNVRIRLGEGIAGGVAQSGRPLLIEDIRRRPGHKPPDESEHPGYADYSAICVPLVIHGQVQGVMNFNNRRDRRPLGEAELALAKLIANQAAVALYTAMLHEEAVAKKTLERELEIARSIQQAFLPSQAPAVCGFRLSARCVMCNHVGGDYYDFIPLTRERLALVIGDVAGHGVASALLMANARAFLRSRLLRDDDISATLHDLNEFLRADTTGDMFMTLLLGILESGSKVFQFVTAGHPMPIVIHEDRIVPRPLAGRNIPLGIEPGWQYRSEEPIHLACGDLMLLFTDGTWEAANADGEEFGLEGLCGVLRSCRHLPEDRVLEELLARVENHRNGTMQDDDYTLIAIRSE